MLRLAASCLALVALLALSGCSQRTTGDTTTPHSTTPPPAQTSAPPGQQPTEPSSTATSGSPRTNSSSSPPAPRPAKTFEVDIQGNQFVGGTLTVQKGDTVHWVHKDGTTPHSVVSDSGKFSSDTQGLPCPGPGCMTSAAHSTFDWTFDEVGDFPYHCEVHANMRNTVTVVAALAS